MVFDLRFTVFVCLSTCQWPACFINLLVFVVYRYLRLFWLFWLYIAASVTHTHTHTHTRTHTHTHTHTRFFCLLLLFCCCFLFAFICLLVRLFILVCLFRSDPFRKVSGASQVIQAGTDISFLPPFTVFFYANTAKQINRAHYRRQCTFIQYHVLYSNPHNCARNVHEHTCAKSRR